MPNKWKENPDGSTDLKEVKKWVINDIKETKEKWAKEDSIKKQQEQAKTQSSSKSPKM
ncbi:hypothetical protein [Spiroplasma ixodetis]|uniref:hypothetical protein n=1 Tax=Spiroplasma ixodetis TaxID=2141 RepID=UPI0025783EB4|nr:hypothetical protein [Spiroplasma ixodetis]WJG71414.1 hypothetical protein SIXOD_v1c28560 [Spiroplasma ixodetis Y32]